MAKRHANQIGNLESLFLRLEELVLANSGEDEFEEVFKLLIAKIWDERTSEVPRFRVMDCETETKEAVIKLLHEANRAWPGVLDVLEPALTPEHLSVCVAALAKHKISDQGLEVLDGFFEFLVAKGAKGAKGQFFTPRYVIELCVRMLRPTVNDTILDPACGSGGFLIHVFNYVKAIADLSTPAAIRRYCEANIFGFDMDARAVRVAKALMVLAGDGSANIIRLNSLLSPEMVGLFPTAEASILTIEDVCRSRLRNHKGFDMILTNPPFAGEVRERHVLDGYDLSRGRDSIERDVIFLERCVELLRPGGRLAIVLPHNKVAANSLSYARQWLKGKARILAVVGLGRNTFLPHTHQKASIIFLQRECAASDYKIFFSISERDGKNSKGQLQLRNPTHEDAWDRIDHDFDEIVDSFDKFCKNESVEAR
jgi:type I restriction enzyme M protein